MAQIEQSLHPIEELAPRRDAAIQVVLVNAWAESQGTATDLHWPEESSMALDSYAETVGSISYQAVYNRLVPGDEFRPISRRAIMMAAPAETAAVVISLTAGRWESYAEHWRRRPAQLLGRLGMSTNSISEKSCNPEKVAEWWFHIHKEADHPFYDAHLLAQVSKLAARIATHEALALETTYFTEEFATNPGKATSLIDNLRAA